MGELEQSLSATEYREWMEFYTLDPWGEQRADMRMSQIVWAALAPHSKAKIDPNDFRLFPDEVHSLPDDIEERERQWMLRLSRSDA